MDLRQLRQFVAVAQELHFARAARKLSMAQPPLSQAIARLEDQIGQKLFERTSRQVKLTDAGHYLLDEAQSLLTRAQAMHDTMHAMSHGQAGEMRVGYNAPAIHGFLAAELKRFDTQQPDIELNLRELTSEEQINELRARRLHVGFARLFGDDQGLQSHLVYEERYVLALPRGHRLARLKKVRLADLRDVRMIRFPREVATSYQDWILNCLRDAEIRPNVALEATSGYANTALVAAGLGVAFAPESLTRWRYPGVVYRPLVDNLPVIQTHMLWNDIHPTPQVARFLSYMKHRASQTRSFTRKAAE